MFNVESQYDFEQMYSNYYILTCKLGYFMLKYRTILKQK